MIEEASDLAIKHANILRARWNRQTEQPLARERKAVLLVHGSDVIEPVEIGNRLKIGLVLYQLFGAAMKQTDMGVDSPHDFPVEFQHQPQDPVRRRMLRPEIDAESTIFGFGRDVVHFFGVSLPLSWCDGRMKGAPSQGERKSKSRNSWTSRTGS